MTASATSISWRPVRHGDSHGMRGASEWYADRRLGPSITVLATSASSSGRQQASRAPVGADPRRRRSKWQLRIGAQAASRGSPGPRQRFAAATGQLENGTPVVSVMGELDLATAPAFERILLDVTEAGTGEVIVDLTGCSFLDSRGLRALMATRARLQRSGRSLALVLSNPSLIRVFQLTQVRGVVQDLPVVERGWQRQRSC